MKVYTKTGDQGQTSLFGGKRVKKSHLRIEAYGTVDELNSWVGLIRDQEIPTTAADELIEIQDRLFTVGSLLATEYGKMVDKLPKLQEEDLTFLEESMDRMDEQLPAMTSFVLPGGHTTVSYCHIARCVCRRSERLVVALQEEEVISAQITQYLNRLSDYLFVLSRFLTKELNANETPWKPRL